MVKKLLYIEPFLTGSHKSWIEGFAHHSAFDVETLGLEGKFWKWRMKTGAVQLADEFLKLTEAPDLIIASDMLDLTTFLSLVRKKLKDIPVGMYFHENQMTYPWSSHEKKGLSEKKKFFGHINIMSAYAADFNLFNSRFHKDVFFKSISEFEQRSPGEERIDLLNPIKEKSHVLPVGLELDGFLNERTQEEIPAILWNHRWEEDKNPEDFFHALLKLSQEEIDFKLIVLGEKQASYPKIFSDIEVSLKKHLVHIGYAHSREQYLELVNQSNILYVTSHHDFFGISVVEAVQAGCYPILPKRLAYPEHLEGKRHFYDSPEEGYKKLKLCIEEKSYLDFEPIDLSRYDWRSMAPHYDQLLNCLSFRRP